MNEGAGEGRVGVRRRRVVDVGVCMLALGTVLGRVMEMGIGCKWTWL